ncbi:pelargonidin 3-O-(6-caffeoylglucoside) 5-O-(6-O-malonylglucoside) 4'''-malonyltransferase-like [Bidens hawaiensis]|uniref:pelargonidin 3-O-(6-caffeoylglucoside) 5-O-(6-O-malonylglucoside) 4'''-malonyltransferase-like n=1 Tax=Bidens hawaiensis TaxID=980011 RepID=UPI00404924CE
MALSFKIETKFSKLIPPFVQTHPTLSHYKLGFIDEFIADLDVGVVLFFLANGNHGPNLVARLENSLAKTLTRFYPLAGRYIQETRTVECNDQGAKFIHAKVNIKLQDFLVSEEKDKFIDEFIPSKIGVAHQQSDPLLATQITMFECGGVAIGVNASHMIVDASTLRTIVNEWAATNREQNEHEFVGPGFNSSVLFPARGISSFPVQPMNDGVLNQYTRIKLSFNESVISNLKAKGTDSTRRWSKVQLVAAIIWKTFMVADLAIYKYQRESILLQAINLREKMGSLIPKDSCGNLIALCATDCKTLEAIEDLTDRLSDSVKKAVTDLSKGCHNREDGQVVVLNSLSTLTNIRESTNAVIVTSWCKFPFYECDFGFGKPIWAAPGTIPINHSAYLIDDAKGSGVEAYVFLQVKDVPYFKEALQHVNAFES